MSYKNLLLALECSEFEIPLIKEAIKIKNITDGALTVVHVNDPDAGKTHMMMESIKKITKVDIIKLIHKAGFEREAEKMNIIIVEDVNFAEKLAELSQKYDLVIAGHRKKNKIIAFLSDSTDERFADRTHCPILLVPLKY